MGITPQGLRALRDYIDEAIERGRSKRKIYAAVVLTETQFAAVQSALRRYWKHEDYDCPAQLPLKPLHGYESRVLKDGFAAFRYREWLEIGCPDAATASVDALGRPFLSIQCIVEPSNIVYDLVVPIRSDVRGHVWVDDVIPKGLWPLER